MNSIIESILSSPIMHEGETQENIIQNGFDYFYNYFLKKEVKPNLKEFNIFYDMSSKCSICTSKFPERFLHSISFSNKLGDIDKTHEFDIYPCTNDVSIKYCSNNCKMASTDLLEFSYLDRYFCYYRLSRIHWIKDIIDLANDEHQNVSVWMKKKKDKSNKTFTQCFVRYNDILNDFIIIFIVLGNSLRFQTAYPVVFKSSKDSLQKDFKAYIDNKKTSEP